MKTFVFLILVFFLSISISFNIVLILSNNVTNKSLHFDDKNVLFTKFPSGYVISESTRQILSNGRYEVFSAYKNLDAKNSSIWIKDKMSQTYLKVIQSSNYSIYSTPKISPDETRLAFVQLYPFAIHVIDLKDSEINVLVSESDKNSNFFPSIYSDYQVYLEWLNNYEIAFENTKGLNEKIMKVNVKTKEVHEISSVQADISKKNIRLDVSHMSQRDLKWKNERLGTCEKHTIETAGCAISAISMVFNYYGISKDVLQINSELTKNENQGYLNGCDVKWYVPVQFSDQIRLKGVYFNEYDLNRVHKEINAGNPVIVGFNFVPFTRTQHWVVIIGYEDGEYIVRDPWEVEAKLKTLKDLGGKFDHIVVYEKINQNGIKI